MPTCSGTNQPLVRQLGRFHPVRAPDTQAHLRPGAAAAARDANVALRGGRTVPVPHFGVVLLMDEWERLAKRLEANSAIDWIERPTIRSNGRPAPLFALHPRPFRQCAGIAIPIRALDDRLAPSS